LNTPFMNGPNSGENVFIPMDWVIGKQAGLGDGWRMLMGCLAAGRAISLPAMGASAGKSCSRFVGAYARVRKQFKLPIGSFEGVQEALARIGGYTNLMDAARRMTAGAIDLGEKPTVLSAILKYHNTEMMRTVINDSMDILGGKGICLGPKNFMGRSYQAVPISITVEGANILTRSMIIFGQGVFRCHPYVLSEIEATVDPDAQQGLVRFDRALAGHIGYTVRNIIRTKLLALTGGRLLRAPVSGPTAPYYRQLSRFATAFTVLADISMLLFGGQLKRMESLSARLGDCLSHLYYGSAALKRFADTGSPEEDLPLLHWGLQHSLYSIQQAMLGVTRNYPLPWIGVLLKWLVFPLGARFQPPTDRLGQAVSRLLMSPSSARDRLTEGIFINRNPDDVTGSLEHALQLMIEAAPVEKKLYRSAHFTYQSLQDDDKLQQAIADGLISQDEAELLKKANAAALQVIQVDDFTAEQIAQAVIKPAAKTGRDTKAA
jgi:acyl-CoA dehydrogenase